MPLKKSKKKLSKKCKSGKILRKSYKTKKGVKVKASCIKDQGKKGKGPKTLPKIKTDMSLGEYGYELKISFEKRQTALKKAVKVYGVIKIIKRLSLIRNYSKSNKTNYNKYTKDIEFLKTLK
jgi:hypothetical protein